MQNIPKARFRSNRLPSVAVLVAQQLPFISEFSVDAEDESFGVSCGDEEIYVPDIAALAIAAKFLRD